MLFTDRMERPAPLWGAAKKIDLTGPKTAEGLGSKGRGDLGRMTDSWSPAFGTSCEPGPWRDLPDRFGPWSSVYTGAGASGLWSRLLEAIARGASEDPVCRLLPHQGSPRRSEHDRRPSESSHGAHQGGLNTKLAAVVDGIGRAVGLSLAPGQQHDLRACAPLPVSFGREMTVADRAFDSNGFRRALASSPLHSTAYLPAVAGARRSASDRELYRHRHVVSFFSRIKRHRRIATRYEKLAVTFHGLLCRRARLAQPRGLSPP